MPEKSGSRPSGTWAKSVPQSAPPSKNARPGTGPQEAPRHTYSIGLYPSVDLMAGPVVRRAEVIAGRSTGVAVVEPVPDVASPISRAWSSSEAGTEARRATSATSGSSMLIEVETTSIERSSMCPVCSDGPTSSTSGGSK
eukprot:scaffold108591_cov40-Prasinocladus_malaysianus.AAC.2